MPTYTCNAAMLGPSLALQTQGQIYKMWDLMYNKLASTNPFRAAAATSPMTQVDAASGGLINFASLTGPEIAANQAVCDVLFTAQARYLNKKK